MYKASRLCLSLPPETSSASVQHKNTEFGSRHNFMRHNQITSMPPMHGMAASKFLITVDPQNDIRLKVKNYIE